MRNHYVDVDITRNIKLRILFLLFELHQLRADVLNYRESGVSREISNFFIFCPSNLYSEVFSKITLKVSTAFYFFRNREKFENTAYRPPSNSEIDGKLHIFISLVR